MLQKIENGFLSILRFIVIAAAAMALIGFVVAGFGALKLAKSEPEPQAFNINISSQKILDKVTDKQPAPVSATTSSASSEPQSQANSNKESYAKAEKAITKFLTAISGQPMGADHNKVVAVIDERAKPISDDDLRHDYIVGMGVALEKVLGNPELIKHAKQSQSPYAFINRTMDSYSDQFNIQVAETEARNNTVKAKYFADKTDGMINLYYAAGLFGTFLLIVFLSIFIKIERNLRCLGNLKSSEVGSAEKKTI